MGHGVLAVVTHSFNGTNMTILDLQALIATGESE
jgi:hypothetical protein